MEEKWELAKQCVKEEGVNDSNEDWINRIDEQILAIMREGEGKSTSVRRPITEPWSTKLHNAIRSVYDWAYKKRMAMKLNQDGIFDEEKLKETLMGCKEAKVELKSVTEAADHYRDEMTKDQANAAKTREGNSHVP